MVVHVNQCGNNPPAMWFTKVTSGLHPRVHATRRCEAVATVRDRDPNSDWFCPRDPKVCGMLEHADQKSTNINWSICVWVGIVGPRCTNAARGGVPSIGGLRAQHLPLPSCLCCLSRSADAADAPGARGESADGWAVQGHGGSGRLCSAHATNGWSGDRRSPERVHDPWCDRAGGGGPGHRRSQALPVWDIRDDIVRQVREHKVVVLTGETGSGKSTQIPQFLLGVGYQSVVCTQPRVLSAVTLAQRVAAEQGARCGERVGYTVRFDDCSSERTRLRYVTDGVLLQVCVCAAWGSVVSHVQPGACTAHVPHPTPDSLEPRIVTFALMWARFRRRSASRTRPSRGTTSCWSTRPTSAPSTPTSS